MDPRIESLLNRFRTSGFTDLAGAEATARVPLGERLLNDLAAEFLPSSGPVREVQVSPQAGDRIRVRARLGSSSLMPPIGLTLAIERQPEFPASPVLVFRVEMGGLLALAGPALRFLAALPPGIRLENDRLFVDLAVLARQHGAEEILNYVERLHVSSIPGAVVVAVTAAVRR